MNKAEVRTKIESEGIRNIILNALPQNATNGDMIKAMFHPYNVEECADVIIIHPTLDDYNRALKRSSWIDGKLHIDKFWWNAPYKAESEDKK